MIFQNTCHGKSLLLSTTLSGVDL